MKENQPPSFTVAAVNYCTGWSNEKCKTYVQNALRDYKYGYNIEGIINLKHMIDKYEKHLEKIINKE